METNRCYVQLISIYNSTVINARILGICERPGALCVDNYGNVLIFDRSSSSVGLYSRAFLGIIIRYFCGQIFADKIFLINFADKILRIILQKVFVRKFCPQILSAKILNSTHNPQFYPF